MSDRFSATSLSSAHVIDINTRETIAPRLGHNRPPETRVQGTVLQQIEAIVDSDLSATKKLILVKIRLRADKKTLGGAIQSHSTLARAASVDDPRTIKAALKDLCREGGGLLSREDRLGQAPRFAFRCEKLEAVITDWVARKNEKQKSALPPSSSVGGGTDQPPSTDVGGSAEPPSSSVGGNRSEPPSFHAAERAEPPSSDVPLSGSIYQERLSSLASSKKEEEARASVREAFEEYLATATRCGLPIPPSPDPWQSSIKARLKEHGLDDWRMMLANVERSGFLCGGGDKGWKADLDWLSKPKNFAKVLSGKYGNGGPGVHQGDPERDRAIAEMEATWQRLNDEEDAECGR